MNYSTAVILINPQIRAMKTIYQPETEGAKSQQRYTFKTIDKDLKVGDLVLVPSDTRFGFTVNQIVDADVEVDFDSHTQMKWIVGKVDIVAYDDILKMEEAAISLIKTGELRKRREEIRKNTLDAVVGGEINKLDIAKLGGNVPAIEAPPAIGMPDDISGL